MQNSDAHTDVFAVGDAEVGHNPEDAVRLALVHDYLTQYGGAEKVLVALQRMYPDAPVLASLHDPAVAIPGLDRQRISESFLGRLSLLRNHHRLALPLYPMAMRHLGKKIAGCDVVLADSSAWSHRVAVLESQAVVVYCHSPARFLYGDRDYLGATGFSGRKHGAWNLLTAPLRRHDHVAWRRADVVLANSRLVQRRLQSRLGVDSTVVYPPIDVKTYRPNGPIPTEPWMLVVSRLVPHKRIDLVIAACQAERIPLRIVGTGRFERQLCALAGPSVEFLGFQPEAAVVELMRRCRALVIPGVEDFGMTSVEAQAAGRPVIGSDRGGTAESIVDGKTGILFADQSVAGLRDAFRRLDQAEIDPEACVANAMRFDTMEFEAGIRSAIARARLIRDERVAHART